MLERPLSHYWTSPLIVNFKNIVDETEFYFYLIGRTFIFQQNDTMIINFG